MISVITPTIRPELLYLTDETLYGQTYKDFEWLVESGDPVNGFTLPTDFNNALRKAKGDIIVILQDCILIPQNALEEISKLNHVKTAYTFPVGKEKATVSNDRAEKEITWDWRKHRDLGELPTPAHWEIDLGSAPKSLFFDVGGFDEDFNNGWSWENVEIAYRASLLSYKYELSRVTEGVAFDHDAAKEHPFRGKRENNDVRASKSRVMADGGRIKLEYL